MARLLRLALLTACCAAASLCALTHTVYAGADVEVGNGDKITGTLRPVSEVETFRVNVPAGATLKVKVKGKRAAKKQPTPTIVFRVFGPDEAEIGAALRKTKRTGMLVKIPGTLIATSAQYRVVVEAEGDVTGNYLLIIKWKSPRSATFDVEEVGAGEQTPLRFGVDAGALVSFKLKSAKGSAATPGAMRLGGPGGFDVPFDPPQGVAKKLDAPVFGELTLTTSGVVAGSYRATIKIKPPKTTKHALDLGADKIDLDPLGGGGDAKGKLVGPAGGSIVFGPDDSSVLSGTALEVPAGALGSPVAILIATAPDIPPPSANEQGAGPSVFFGPDGLEFLKDVTATIPFDAEAFGISVDNLRVFTRDADGNITEVTAGVSFDVDSGTCTFPTAHFSSFRVFGPRLPAPATQDLDYDGFGDAVLIAPLAGAGRVYVAPGGPNFAGGSTATAPIVLTGESDGDTFGTHFATGDVNDDGREDLVVGAPGANKVYLFLGGSGFASRDAQDADAIYGARPGDLNVGVRVAVGDLNGDGFDDILAGAEGSAAGRSSTGVAYVFWGRSYPGSRSTAFSDVTLSGEQDLDAFGASVAIADVTGDGVGDAIVGADRFRRDENGIVYVFNGGSGMRSGTFRDAAFTLVGASDLDVFGLEVAAGDVTGDGVADVIVAAMRDDSFQTNAGAVYVYRGGALDGPPLRLSGEAGSDEFGFAVAVGDLDGDQVSELICSSRFHSGSGGAIYGFIGGAGLVTANASTAAFKISGENSSDRLGSLQQLADVNGDGALDLLGYAPEAGAGGRAYVFFGTPRPTTGSAATADVVFTGQPGDRLGIAFDD